MVKTFSVIRKKVPSVTFNNNEKRLVQYFSQVLDEHFSMSEELAKAIGTVVVQALTENAKDEEALSDDSLDLGEDDDDLFGDLDESELPESARDAGEVEEAEGPKNAPDLSSDFAELKQTVSNHSIHTFAEDRYQKVKKFLTLTED